MIELPCVVGFSVCVTGLTLRQTKACNELDGRGSISSPAGGDFGELQLRMRLGLPLAPADLIYCTEQSLATGEKRGNRG